jgi:HAE1 family hydrophobic/amphiphilic exporter-1
MWGAQFKEIDVYLRLNDLKRYRVDVDRLFRRLDTLNANQSLGRVEDSGYEFNAIFLGTIASIAEIEEFPVNDRGLRLEEVADIVYDHPDVNWGRRLNGRQSLGFGIKKNSNAHTVEVVRRVKAELEKIRQDPRLEGLDILVWRDSAADIVNSLTGLLNAGLFGALLAIFVLLAFVRHLALTATIGLAIPFSIIAAIGFLYLSGKTLNSMTMLGLMLAAGMLVDNAVVVLESIYQKLEKGMDRELAAQVGTHEVATAVSAATLTSIIIFVPLIFGQLNDFSIRLTHTGVAIIFAVICSLFISLTLIPLAMARLLRIEVSRRTAWQQWTIDRFSRFFTRLGRLVFRRRGSDSEDKPAPLRKPGYGRVTEGYLRLVQWPIRYRFLVGLIMVPALVGVSMWLLINKIPDNTPEAQDLDWISIQYDFSENYHYAKIEEDYVNRVEEFLLSNKERLKITDVESGFGNNRAWTWVYFDKEKMTLEDVQKTNSEISKGLPVIPGARISLGQGSGRNQNWFGANLYGDDPNILQDLAKQVRSRLLARPDFTSVYTDRRGAEEEVQIRLNRDLARKYGVSPDSVSQILSTVVRGRRIRAYRTSQGEVDIWIRLQAGDRENLDDLASLVIGRGPEGQEILLSQVADLPVERVAGVLQRQNRRTTTWVTAVYSGEKRAEGKKLMEDALNLLDFPEGYGWNYGFWTQREDEGEQAFVFNIVLALFMVYFVMASLFESFTHPLAIMFSLPFAVVGIVLLLMITGAPFNWMAKIGSLVLVGIVVNNGIILIDHINNLRRKGLLRSQAILEGCRERLRPIVMTASTTVVSLIPLAFGSSGMLRMRYFPMAQTLMGGLLVSTILTLIILPTYYTLFDDLAKWVKRTWRVTDPAERLASFPAGRHSESRT